MKKISKESIYKILSLSQLCILLYIFLKYAGIQSFWLDELDWTINFLAKSDNYLELFHSLIISGYNLPLYYIIMFPIYKIAPFGEFWLLIPNFIFVVMGIYFVYKIGNKIEKNLGFACLFISATSFTLITNCVFELRPYALLFCISAFTLYRYICKLQDSKSYRNIVLYTLSIIFLAYTHWFGCLIIAFYFFTDIILWIKKKNTISFILPYIALGIVFIPYFIIMMSNHIYNFTNYWSFVPTIKDLFVNSFSFLLSYNIICILLFIFGIIFLLLNIFKKNEKQNISKNIIFVLLGSIFWILGTTFIYSKFINPNGSLWVLRYFIVILPHLFIITSISILKLTSASFQIQITPGKISKSLIKKILGLYLIVLIIIFIICFNYAKVHVVETSLREPYREISDFIAKTPDVYDENCALVISVGKGFLTYYFEKRGIDLPSNIFVTTTEKPLPANNIEQCVSGGKIIDPINKNFRNLLKYDKLYVIQVHENLSTKINNFINYYYDGEILDDTLNIYLYTKK